MSAYVVDNKTISALALAFETYGVKYEAENLKDTNPFGCNWIVDVASLRHDIGQSLLEQNYESVNSRYSEETEAPEFEFEEVAINEGIVKGCIDCYIYQACETRDFFETTLYKSLLKLKDKLLDRLISQNGYEVPWGYGALEY